MNEITISKVVSLYNMFYDLMQKKMKEEMDKMPKRCFRGVWCDYEGGPAYPHYLNEEAR